jgi:hypothetical protein
VLLSEAAGPRACFLVLSDSPRSSCSARASSLGRSHSTMRPASALGLLALVAGAFGCPVMIMVQEEGAGGGKSGLGAADGQ